MVDKRLRYFDGQFLQDQDFIDEQEYHLDRERRPLKSLTIAGVCEGLTVTAQSKQVTVAPGMAIDPEGRQMVVESPEVVDLTAFVPQTGKTKPMNLFVAYQEEASDPATEGSQGNRRWYEKTQVTALDASESQPENAVKLAKLTVEPDGTVIVDAGVCEYSGLHLPNGNGNGAILRYQSDGNGSRPILTGDLTVSGNLGIGTTTSPEKKLHVESGELKVKASHNETTADIAAFLANNGTAGIGIGKNRLEAIGTDADQNIEMRPKGTGKVKVFGDLRVENDKTLIFDTKSRQMIDLWGTAYGIGIQNSTQYFRTGENFAWYKGGDHNDDKLNAGGGTVQMVIKNGNVGIGKANPEERLHVDGRIKDKTGYVIPVGTIIAYGGGTAPAGWMLCDGSQYDKNTYPDLFDVIGYSYGGSSSQFKVPDLRDRFPVGAGNSYKLNDSGGFTTVTLTRNQMPQHNHGVSDPGHTHGYYYDRSGGKHGDNASDYRNLPLKGTNSNTNSSRTNISILNEGGNQAHENRPPYRAIYFIIKF